MDLLVSVSNSAIVFNHREFLIDTHGNKPDRTFRKQEMIRTVDPRPSIRPPVAGNVSKDNYPLVPLR
jgi:hypothetical protein